MPYIRVCMRDCTSMMRDRPKSATLAVTGPWQQSSAVRSITLPPLKSACDRANDGVYSKAARASAGFPGNEQEHLLERRSDATADPLQMHLRDVECGGCR